MDIFEQTKKDLQEFIDKAEVFIEQQETKLNAMREPPTYQKKYDVVEELKQRLAELEKKNDKLGTDLYNAENIVSDLQQQLAEKEKLIEFYINSGKELCGEINRINHHATKQAEEIDRLNTIIEVKDETIKHYKDWVDDLLLTSIDHESHYAMRDEYEKEIEELKIYQNQIAIEQLEKVKEKVEKRNNGTRQSNHSEQYKDGYSGCCCDIQDFIDNQIKAIKGDK